LRSHRPALRDPEWIAVNLASGAVQRRGRALGLRPASLLVAARMVSWLRLAPSVVVATSLASLVGGQKAEGADPPAPFPLAFVAAGSPAFPAGRNRVLCAIDQRSFDVEEAGCHQA
jgi:hypothetical protein